MKKDAFISIGINKITALAAQHGLHLTPLARPQNRGVFHARGVPSLVSLYISASGAGEAQRWAALRWVAYAH